MTRNGATAGVRPALILTTALLAGPLAPVSAQRGPAPAPTGVPSEVLALVCIPKPAYEMPDRSLRITGGQDSFVRHSYAQGDLLTVNGGTDNGIEVGQRYFVRRLQTNNTRGVSRRTPGTIRTSGWIRIYAVDKQLSLATVEYGCDSIDPGDYLEPFALSEVAAPSTTNAKPQRGNYGRILFGNDRRNAFGKGDLFVIDRGSDHGVEPGARFVVYRDQERADNFLFDLGEAIAVDVRSETSTLKVTVSRDAFIAGDYVAMRK